jgi:predicted lipoprotein with Yx(FWY)xxD motif
MRRKFTSIAAIAAVTALVIAIAGCGGSSSSDTTASAQMGGGGGNTTGGGTNVAVSSKSAGSTIALKKTALGTFLVDPQGRTLYLFEADKTNMSNCSGACLSIWPPFTSSTKPQAASGVDAAKIGTIANNQVTYNGHPLYTYVGDQKPGDTSGEGLDQFGAKWYVLAASGDKIDND